MSGLIESATAILSASEKRLEAVSNNVANVSTPGYKRQISFADLVQDNAHPLDAPTIQVRPDFAQGKLASTGNPLDIAISGDGFFQLRNGNDLIYSRQGQFRLADDGTLVTPQGYALQQASGGDVVLDHATVEIQPDGTVLDADQPVSRIGVFAAPAASMIQSLDGSTFRFGTGAPEEVADPQLRQGMTEASNVSVGDEMVTMMAALRQAESGSRIVQTWDDLLGKAITAFGSGQ